MAKLVRLVVKCIQNRINFDLMVLVPSSALSFKAFRVVSRKAILFVSLVLCEAFFLTNL